MFRSRFTEAFPPKCPHLGPQDVERGVSDPLPSPQIESLLCALLGLVVNRKKPVESVCPRHTLSLFSFWSHTGAAYLRRDSIADWSYIIEKVTTDEPSKKPYILISPHGQRTG
jgi:hypothetical protein